MSKYAFTSNNVDANNRQFVTNSVNVSNNLTLNSVISMYNWDLLLALTRDVPDNLNKSKTKEDVPDEMRQLIKERDKTCRLCGNNKNLVIHHVIPNAEATPDNLILLCRRCHTVVHMLLALSGKWKQVNIYQMMGMYRKRRR